MGEACGTYGGEQMYIQGSGEATRIKDATWRNYYRRLDDKIKMDLKEVVLDDVDLICLIQRRDKLWAVVNAAMKFRFVNLLVNWGKL